MAPEVVPEAKRVKRVELEWRGRGLVFEGGKPGGVPVVIDGDSTEGPSPMDTFLLGLGACMASDIVDILKKSRVQVDGLSLKARGDRALESPRRFLRIEMVFRAVGPADGDKGKLERALALSRETYCSFVHSIRPDIELDFRIERA